MFGYADDVRVTEVDGLLAGRIDAGVDEISGHVKIDDGYRNFHILVNAAKKVNDLTLLSDAADPKHLGCDILERDNPVHCPQFDRLVGHAEYDT